MFLRELLGVNHVKYVSVYSTYDLSKKKIFPWKGVPQYFTKNDVILTTKLLMCV